MPHVRSHFLLVCDLTSCLCACVLCVRACVLCVRARVCVGPSSLGAREAIELYAQAHFCLQPPGDVIARGAIVDALSVGCIPVFFLRGQAALWPWHWNASDASVLFDWAAVGSARNATAVMHALVAMHGRTAELRRRQAAVVDAAPRLLYRGAGAAHDGARRGKDAEAEAAGGVEPDAVDVLLARLGAWAARIDTKTHAARPARAGG